MISKSIYWKIFWKLCWKEVKRGWIFWIIIGIGLVYLLDGIPLVNGIQLVEVVRRGLIVSGALGFTIGFVFPFFHIIGVQKLARCPEEVVTSHHTRELKFSHPYDEAFKFCLNALESLGKYKIRDTNFDQGKIIVQKDIVFKTIILFDLHKQDTTTIVHLTTKGAIFLDNGYSLKYILKLQQSLSPYLAKE